MVDFDYRVEKMTEMRKNGCSLEECGDYFSLSKERVRQLLRGIPGTKGFKQTKTSCVYDGLRKWMNENDITVSKLCKICGLSPLNNNLSRMKQRLSGRIEFSLRFISAIVEESGLTFEELFLNRTFGGE